MLCVRKLCCSGNSKLKLNPDNPLLIVDVMSSKLHHGKEIPIVQWDAMASYLILSVKVLKQGSWRAEHQYSTPFQD
jgi:hypothetical protein